ncbi:hypothetical protein PV10_03724 [Exophiala mesophila]|uniref:Aldehyde dehydrogenase domain-containing protein n=1 Tax=Exophiala mesophila TaxID=212818 RepID=A0A0D1ZEW6_EXOME|nr:uncharacterized protein PV10_03724 [Exophiala mesophila]KIV92424.1 hypothetical protein PV10_03724 [Exophiala mesophila]
MSIDSLSRIEISRLEGRASSIRLRQNQFHRLQDALTSSEGAIKGCLIESHGYGEDESGLEYALALSELRTHYLSLNLKRSVELSHSIEDLSATTGVGIVYLIPTKQNPFYSVISVLTSALAAGNCVVVELPPQSSPIVELLQSILTPVLDRDLFAFSNSRPSAEFLSTCHLVSQTDDRAKVPYNSANAALSRPSGNAVAIVERSADINATAKAITTARLAFRGHSAYAPDLILVNEFVANEFLRCLKQALAAPKGLLPRPETQVRDSRSDNINQILRELEKSQDGSVLFAGDHGSIVEIADRTKASTGYKITAPVFVIYRTTSLDDAVDISNNISGPTEASYLFADPSEAIYLSKYIESRISFVNQIPAELLVGPLAPGHPSVPPSLSPRYPADLFRSPRPRLSRTTALTKALQRATLLGTSDPIKKWYRSTTGLSLPAIGQKEENSGDFFGLGFAVFGVGFISLAAGGALMVWRSRK